MLSHECHSISDQWWLYCLFIRLAGLQQWCIKNQNFAGQWIHRANNMASVSISWCHCDITFWPSSKKFFCHKHWLLISVIISVHWSYLINRGTISWKTILLYFKYSRNSILLSSIELITIKFWTWHDSFVAWHVQNYVAIPLLWTELQ